MGADQGNRMNGAGKAETWVRAAPSGLVYLYGAFRGLRPPRHPSDEDLSPGTPVGGLVLG